MGSVDRRVSGARLPCGPCGDALLHLQQVRMSIRNGGVGWVYRCPGCGVVAVASQSTKWVPGMAAPLPVTHLVYGGVPRPGQTLDFSDTVVLDGAALGRHDVVPDLLAVCSTSTIVVQGDDRPVPHVRPLTAAG